MVHAVRKTTTIVCLYQCVCVYTLQCTCGHQNNLLGLVFSFLHANPRNSAQVIRFGCNHLYLLSHLASP